MSFRDYQWMKFCDWKSIKDGIWEFVFKNYSFLWNWAKNATFHGGLRASCVSTVGQIQGHHVLLATPIKKIGPDSAIFLDSHRNSSPTWNNQVMAIDLFPYSLPLLCIVYFSRIYFFNHLYGWKMLKTQSGFFISSFPNIHSSSTDGDIHTLSTWS